MIFSTLFNGYGSYVIGSYGLVAFFMIMGFVIARKSHTQTQLRLSKWFLREKN